VCIGYAKDDVSVHSKRLGQKELDIRGSRNAMLNDFAAVIRYFLAGGRKHAEKLISATVKPEETGDALAKWDAAPGKVFRILVEF
ncbi:MAG: sorbitol dehydrogenase, partial [Duncaniella sp.]|nr:sorbitol dehydrogenase [Duncaniella sp.]